MTTPTSPVPASRHDDMFSPTLQRLSAASGLIAAILFIVSIFASTSDYPDFDAPAGEWASYYAENADKIQLSALILALALIAFAWFAGFLRGELGRVELARRGFTRASHGLLVGAALVVTGLVGGSAIEAAVASLPRDTDPQIFRALGNVTGAVWMVGVVGLVLFLTTAGLVTLATRRLPVWTGWLALVAALAWFLLLFQILDPTNEDSPLGGAWIVGFLGFQIWLIATSVSLLRAMGRAPEAAEGP